MGSVWAAGKAETTRIAKDARRQPDILAKRCHALRCAAPRVRPGRCRAPGRNASMDYVLASHSSGECRMNPVVAVIAPGMMGAAVGGRLVDHGLKVLTSLDGPQRRDRGARQGRRPDRRERRGDRRRRFHPVDPAAGRRASRWRSASRRRSPPATASRCSSTATPSARRPPSASPPCIAPTGSPFVDAGIIGSPPQDRRRRARASTPPVRRRRASPRSRTSASTCGCSTAR